VNHSTILRSAPPQPFGRSQRYYGYVCEGHQVLGCMGGSTLHLDPGGREEGLNSPVGLLFK